MLLADVVETSTTVSATRSRLAKIDALASLLAGVPADEIVAATGYLVGDAPQGRIGIGWATVARPRRREQRRAGPDHRRRLERDRCRARRHRSRFGPRPTRPPRPRCSPARHPPRPTSSAGCSLGELRQGALAGVMTDAIARAAGRPASPSCGAPRCSAATSRDHRAPRAHRRRRRARGGRSSRCCGRCSRCSRRPRPTSPRRSPRPGPRRSSGSSTARASRCTATATTCASSRATSTTSPSGCPRSSPRCARSPRTTLVLDGEAIGVAEDERPRPLPGHDEPLRRRRRRRRTR